MESRKSNVKILTDTMLTKVSVLYEEYFYLAFRNCPKPEKLHEYWKKLPYFNESDTKIRPLNTDFYKLERLGTPYNFSLFANYTKYTFNKELLDFISEHNGKIRYVVGLTKGHVYMVERHFPVIKFKTEESALLFTLTF